MSKKSRIITSIIIFMTCLFIAWCFGAEFDKRGADLGCSMFLATVMSTVYFVCSACTNDD